MFLRMPKLEMVCPENAASETMDHSTTIEGYLSIPCIDILLPPPSTAVMMLDCGKYTCKTQGAIATSTHGMIVARATTYLDRGAVFDAMEWPRPVWRTAAECRVDGVAQIWLVASRSRVHIHYPRPRI